jgi:hypothetical protein
MDLPPANSEFYSDLLPFLKLKRFLFQLSLEWTHLVVGEDIIFCAFFWAIPCGRTAESSAIPEGALRDHFAVGFHDLVGRLLGTMP